MGAPIKSHRPSPYALPSAVPNAMRAPAEAGAPLMKQLAQEHAVVETPLGAVDSVVRYQVVPDCEVSDRQ